MQLGDHNSSVHVPTAFQSSKSEPELLIERVRDVYSHLLPSNCTIFLQVKDEKWGGALWATLKALSLTSIFRIVTGKKVA